MMEWRHVTVQLVQFIIVMNMKRERVVGRGGGGGGGGGC